MINDVFKAFSSLCKLIFREAFLFPFCVYTGGCVHSCTEYTQKCPDDGQVVLKVKIWGCKQKKL